MTHHSYAGIGSRKTPGNVLTDMYKLAEHLGQIPLILRSGAADGADTAFEKGCDAVSGPKEIYIPWFTFNGRSSKERGVIGSNAFTYPEAERLAEYYHPNWDRLSEGGRGLMVRNSYQILGDKLYLPALFVVCWTPGGKGGGGTGQAIRMAKAYNIPVFDLGAITIDQCVDGIVEILKSMEITA